MNVDKFDSVMIWSENWRELANWYMDTFHFEKGDEVNLFNDTGMTLKVGKEEVILWIGYHDKVTGKNKDPFRIMIGFHVDDVYQSYEELSAKGVEFISKPQVSPTKDYDVATAVDPEGNVIQLFHFFA